MINILNSINLLGIFSNITDCKYALGEETVDIIRDVYTAIQVAIPILVILLCTVDIAKAVIAQEEKDMQAAISKSIKRVIIGLAIFFIPGLLDAILDLVGLATGTCLGG